MHVVEERTNNSNASNTDQAVNGDSSPVNERTPENNSASNWGIGWLWSSVITQVINLGLDVQVVILYATAKEYVNVAGVVFLMCKSNWVRTFLSFQIHTIRVQQNNRSAEGSVSSRTSLNWTEWIWQQKPCSSSIFLLVPVPLIPLLREGDNLRFALQSRYDTEQRQFYNGRLTLEAASDIALLKMFMCFSGTAAVLNARFKLPLTNFPIETIDHTDQAVGPVPPSPSAIIRVGEPSETKENRVSNWDVISSIINIGIYVHTVYRNIDTERYIYLAWTVLFLFASVKTLYSYVKTCVKKQRKHQEAGNNEQSASPSSTNCVWQWVSHVFLCLFQLVPLIHDFDSLRSALKSRQFQRLGTEERQRPYYERWLKAPPNEALLGIFVCFFENVPQKVLRFTELLSNPHEPIDLVTFPFRMISMGRSVANYHRTIERVQTDTTNIDIIEDIIYSICHSFIIASRIVCICVAANICFGCTVGACILHWAAMTIWLVADTHGVAEFSEDISGTPLLELANCKGFGRILLALTLGSIYIFTYVNPGRRSTNSRNVYYYVASFVENVIAMFLWLIYSGDTLKDQWFYVPLAIFCVLVPAFNMISTIIAYMSVGKTNAAPTDDRTHPPSYESHTRSQSQTHPVQSESAHNTLSTLPDELSNSSGSLTTDSAIDNEYGPFANPDRYVRYRRRPRLTKMAYTWP